LVEPSRDFLQRSVRRQEMIHGRIESLNLLRDGGKGDRGEYQNDKRQASWLRHAGDCTRSTGATSNFAGRARVQKPCYPEQSKDPAAATVSLEGREVTSIEVVSGFTSAVRRART